MNSSPRRHRGNRGSVLIITLAVMAGLVAVLATAASEQHEAVTAQIHRMEASRARLTAESAIQAAITELATQSTSTTLQTDDWFNFGQNGAIRYVVGDTAYRLQIIDASSLINMNTAPEAQLNQLPLTAEQIDSFLDWRETGQTARSDGGKDQYYNNLDNPYNAKLGNLDSIAELALVKGWTPQTIYTPQTNVSSPAMSNVGANGQPLALIDLVTVDSYSSGVAPGGAPRTNIRTLPDALALRGITPALATQIYAQRATFNTIADVLRIGGMTVPNARILLNGYSVGTTTKETGRINLNTASQAVLSTVSGITPDVAASIVTLQQSGFAGLGNLLDVPGVNVATAARMASSFEANGQVFIVRILATAGSVQIAEEATIQIGGTGPQLLRVATPAYADPMTHWNWTAETTSDVVQKVAE